MIFPMKAKVSQWGNYIDGKITLTRQEVMQLELFESIMPVVLAAVVCVMARAYLRRVTQHHVREGMLLGWLWLLISIGIDVPLMLSPPIRMPPAWYFCDVGLAYLMMPIITGAMGAVITTRLGSESKQMHTVP